MYEKKVADGFEVLEITKGTWIEAIFAKVKPINEKPKLVIEDDDEIDLDDEDRDDDLPEIDDKYDNSDDDDDYDEDKLTEESYRTTIEENPEDLDLTAEDVADEEDMDY